MEKIETLENIIADRLRVISDLDNKLQVTRGKRSTHASVEPPKSSRLESRPSAHLLSKV